MKLLKYLLMVFISLLSNFSYAGLGSNLDGLPLWFQIIILTISGIMWICAIYWLVIEPIIKKIKHKND